MTTTRGRPTHRTSGWDTRGHVGHGIVEIRCIERDCAFTKTVRTRNVKRLQLEMERAEVHQVVPLVD